MMPSDMILNELRRREPIFHRREYGTARAELEQMTDRSFWEIGASGKVYQRDYVINTMLKRYAEGPEPHDWPCRDFSILQVGQDTYLVSYTLDEPDRTSKRSTIWRKTRNVWQIVFHQGTVVQN
jgi:hypothetical protein